MITLLIEHEGSNGPASVGTIASLAMNLDCSAAPTKLILGAGDGVSGHQHNKVSGLDDKEWR